MMMPRGRFSWAVGSAIGRRQFTEAAGVPLAPATHVRFAGRASWTGPKGLAVPERTREGMASDRRQCAKSGVAR